MPPQRDAGIMESVVGVHGVSMRQELGTEVLLHCCRAWEGQKHRGCDFHESWTSPHTSLPNYKT